MEVAMKLLEKDIHDKQDTIISLRRQLDDIKLINLEMYKKLQVSPVCNALACDFSMWLPDVKYCKIIIFSYSNTNIHFTNLFFDHLKN